MTIIRGLNIEAYHAHRAITNSKLKVFRRSPLLYHRVYNEKSYQIPQTRALLLGKAIDTLLFDHREVYARQYVTKPDTYPGEDGTPKKWRANAGYCEAWELAQTMRGREILTLEESRQIEWMHDAIKRHPLAMALLSQGESQVTFRRHSERFDMEIQTRPDHASEKPIEEPSLGLSSEGLPYIVDLKSTDDFDRWFSVLDPESPRNGIPVYTFGYYRQAGLAQWIAAQDIGPTAHFLIVVEKQQPFRVGVVQLNAEYLDLGYQEIQADLQRLRACMTANVWPGSVERVITLKPPQWLLDQAGRQEVAATEAGMPSADLSESLAEVGP